MKIEVTKEWCEIMARREANAEIGAGLVAADPVFDGEIGPVAILDDTHLVLGRFVELNRRKDKLTLEKLANRADVEIAELMNIESDAHYKPSVRTVYQLAQHFKVSQKRLMEISGLTKPKDVRFIEEAVRYAARSETTEALNPEEEAALDGLIKVLSEK